MGTASLLNAFFRRLTSDVTFLGFKGLTPSSNISLKATYVVQEEETDGVVTSTSIPIALLYTRPGKADNRSSRVYIGKVVLDCFAASGNTARQMVDQAITLCQNWEPDSTFAFVCIHAYDTSFKTGIQGVKGHRVYFDVSRFIG